MKLRIRDNTLRFRLGQSEVEQLGSDQSVACSVVFGSGQDAHFRYAVRCGTDAPSAQYRKGNIEITITPEQQKVLEGGIDGVAFVVETGADRPLHVFVEPDFQCLNVREGEDESDAFANPAVDPVR